MRPPLQSLTATSDGRRFGSCPSREPHATKSRSAAAPGRHVGAPNAAAEQNEATVTLTPLGPPGLHATEALLDRMRRAPDRPPSTRSTARHRPSRAKTHPATARCG